MNPAPIPWIMWFSRRPPREDRGARRLDRDDLDARLARFSTSPTPVIVPPVPTPAMNTSIAPPVSSHISTAVVSPVGSGVGGVVELLELKRAGDRCGELARGLSRFTHQGARREHHPRAQVAEEGQPLLGIASGMVTRRR